MLRALATTSTGKRRMRVVGPGVVFITISWMVFHYISISFLLQGRGCHHCAGVLLLATERRPPQPTDGQTETSVGGFFGIAAAAAAVVRLHRQQDT